MAELLATRSIPRHQQVPDLLSESHTSGKTAEFA